tara:strand:+ start:1300 stop:1608 length:309 start_codon:yes stop_codon:yes gene_type:complete
MSYYNTTKQRANQLKNWTQQALSQEMLIRKFMELNKDLSFTPFEIQDAFLSEDIRWPITSVRRALTNLTKDKIIVKTDELIDGGYGRPNYKWQWKGEYYEEK